MNIQAYISSGIVESYCLGLANASEKEEFEMLMLKYPSLHHALRTFEGRLDECASAGQIQPPPLVKIRLLDALLEQETGLTARLQLIPKTSDGSLNMEHLLYLIAEMPELISELTGRQFEEFAATLLQQQGYSVTLTPATRDGGKDIIVAHHTSFGQFLYFVECKKYSPARKVGVDMLRQLYGVIAHDNITAGILVTNTYFTEDAIRWQKTVEYRIKLVDHAMLMQWLSDWRKKAL